MTKDEYSNHMVRAMILAHLVRTMPLEEMLEMHNLAHAMGPFLDPTLYRDALYEGKLGQDESALRALQKCKSDFDRECAKAGVALFDHVQQVFAVSKLTQLTVQAEIVTRQEEDATENA